MIKWQEAYSTGVEKLDEQHKNLFKYSNELGEGIKMGDSSKKLVELSLKFLERYVEGHFGQEETCMHRYACPVAGENKLAHQEFIQNYKKFQSRIIHEDSAENSIKDLHEFLENWLVKHICQIDVKLKPCVH